MPARPDVEFPRSALQFVANPNRNQTHRRQTTPLAPWSILNHRDGATRRRKGRVQVPDPGTVAGMKSCVS